MRARASVSTKHLADREWDGSFSLSRGGDPGGRDHRPGVYTRWLQQLLFQAGTASNVPMLSLMVFRLCNGSFSWWIS